MRLRVDANMAWPTAKEAIRLIRAMEPWDLELVELRGDTLLVRHTDDGATLRVPLMQIDELRLIAKAEKRANEPDARAIEHGLMGTGDPVFRLTLRDRAERTEIVRQILASRGSHGP